MFEIAPSILSADFARLGEEIKETENLGIKYLHIDVMDGLFVPNISFGMPVIKSIRKTTDMIFDVHLMISEPEKYIEDFANAGADIINFHAEATHYIEETIEKIKKVGKKAGITIKPYTDIGIIKKYIKDVDLVLVMSVEPGFGGQKFMPHTLEKVKELSNVIKEINPECILEIDGGVNENNLREIINAGCDLAVLGSAFYGKKDRKSIFEKYTKIINEAIN